MVSVLTRIAPSQNTHIGLEDFPPPTGNGIDLHIGIDDTDSKLGGCTTHTAALVFEELSRRGFVPLDFPWLVRLNPNVPWKTRGNGALSVHFNCEENRLTEAEDAVKEIVERTSDPSIPSTDPAVVFLKGHPTPALSEFSKRALHDVIKTKEANKLAREADVDTFTLGGRRGIIGALAAVAYDMETDHTFEVIAYRTKENCGTRRNVDPDSVRKMDSKYGDRTFNNVDPETRRVLVSPHGPDPVLLGIRGDDPATLLQALSEVVIREPVERVMLFKTNHGTDAHITVRRDVAGLRPYESAVITGRVNRPPIVLKGGHVIFSVQDETGSLDCAAYQQTGSLRKVARALISGDLIQVSGGIRLGPLDQATLNIEKLEVVNLAETNQFEKPRCPRCSHSCESMGRNQGFRCRKCGTRVPRNSLRLGTSNRMVEPGIYAPPPRSHRHLTRPLSRLSR
ncbi:DUF1743 domain-containing protein [Candidatus Bathyarchaeota archaeon]|nr:MAG: DUF1743 domain-containing protein [Candidatus Bathyarchaeota archaeon]